MLNHLFFQPFIFLKNTFFPSQLFIRYLSYVGSKCYIVPCSMPCIIVLPDDGRKRGCNSKPWWEGLAMAVPFSVPQTTSECCHSGEQGDSCTESKNNGLCPSLLFLRGCISSGVD